MWIRESVIDKTRRVGMSLVMGLSLLSPASAPSFGQSFYSDAFESDTWANWSRRLEAAFKDFNPRKLPGRAMGIILPANSRKDILAMPAYGYEVLAPQRLGTVIFLMPAPEKYPLNGLVMPEVSTFRTNFGDFQVDDFLRSSFQSADFPIFVDDTPFYPKLPTVLETQLACLKFYMKGRAANVKVLPIMVKLQDPNYQVKDLGPFLAETINNMGFEDLVSFVVLADLTRTTSPVDQIQVDNRAMNAVGDLDIDAFLEIHQEGETSETPTRVVDVGPLALGILTLRWMGADHSEILTYAHSGQLILTKNKSIQTSYLVAGFASDPIIPPRIPHMDREKLVDIFDELFRSDILTLTRQACQSILDPTSAKPPSLIQKEGRKKWPVYVSLYGPDTNVAGEAGTHKELDPLEESLRRYSFKAVQKAKPKLTKDNFANYVVEVSIPYGFNKVDIPEELIPLLNGIIVTRKQKTYGFHPNSWREYPHPHQLLSAICHKLGLKPWDYATRNAKVESFRVLAFNEKEPFQDLGAAKRKKKKKKDQDDDFGDGGDFGGGDDFTF